MDDPLPPWIPLPNGKVLLREDYETSAKAMGMTVPDMLALAKKECAEKLEKIQRLYGLKRD